MAMTSSAPPMPCGKPCVPAAASVPVSSIVCTGLVRRRQPCCGPFMSKGCESEKLAPRRTSAAARARFGIVDEVERAEHVVVAPAAPVAVRLGGLGDVALGIGAVELGRVLGGRAAGSRPRPDVLIAPLLGDGTHGLRTEPLDRADHDVAVAQHPAVHDAVAGRAAREQQVARAAAACSARRRR